MRIHFAPLIALQLALCAPAGRPRLAEILYDPAGGDAGHEFVELFNPGPLPLPLAGLRLEAGDGAGPGRWTLRWSAAARDTVAGGARFVIGGALVVPAPQSVAVLDLQNGPDAVRLVWPDGVIEVVGYGALSYPEYFCGAPAADAPGGQSLARLPDDADRGANALDFSAAEPSPGGANQVRLDVAIGRGSLRAEPAQPAAGAALRVSAVAINRGADALAPASWRARAFVDGEAVAGEAGPGLNTGDSARVALELPGLAEGVHSVTFTAELPGDERAGNQADTLRVRSGRGPLEITEIQFHPAMGEGEWVEVRARDGEVVPLAAFSLSDRVSSGTALPADAPSLSPDSFAVLAQNRPALLARFPSLDSARVIAVSPWPSLNNTDDSSGFADAAVLRERAGLPCDRVDYSARGIPPGTPIERGPAGWGEDSEPAGTPLRPPRQPPEIPGRFALRPRRLPAGAAPALAWSLPWARAWLSVEIFDLTGRRVARLAEEAVAARGERPLAPFEWPGVYFVALRARAASGSGVVRETQTVRVEGMP